MYEHVISFYYQNNSPRIVAYYMSMHMSLSSAYQLVTSSLGLSAVFLVSKLVCFLVLFLRFVCVCRCQRNSENGVRFPLDLGLWIFMSHLVWVLETKLWLSEKAAWKPKINLGYHSFLRSHPHYFLRQIFSHWDLGLVDSARLGQSACDKLVAFL